MTPEQIAHAHILIEDYRVWLFPFPLASGRHLNRKKKGFPQVEPLFLG